MDWPHMRKLRIRREKKFWFRKGQWEEVSPKNRVLGEKVFVELYRGRGKNTMKLKLEKPPSAVQGPNQ